MKSTRPSAVRESARLLSTARCQGTEIHDAEGRYVGEIEEIMIDRSTGWAAYAIVSCGGWLGTGGKFHPLPWSVLEYVSEQDAYVIAIEQSTLDRAPAYTREEIADPAASWGDFVHHHYGAPPYWS